MLTQERNEAVAIAISAKDPQSNQQLYSATAKEGYAIVLALQPWKDYLFRLHFTVVTDHVALRCLYSVQNTTLQKVTQWDFIIVTLIEMSIKTEDQHICVRFEHLYAQHACNKS